MTQCPRCHGSIARGTLGVRGSFACPNCGIPLAVAPSRRWLAKVSCGLLAGVIAGLAPRTGGGLFAALVGAAVALADLPWGNLPLVPVGARREKLARSLLQGAAVGLCAAFPYAVIRAFSG